MAGIEEVWWEVEDRTVSFLLLIVVRFHVHVRCGGGKRIGRHFRRFLDSCDFRLVTLYYAKLQLRTHLFIVSFFLSFLFLGLESTERLVVAIL